MKSHNIISSGARKKVLSGARVLILIGRPGSGKGTQLALLKKRFNLFEIDTGALLRNFAKQKNPLAKKIIEVISKGSLVPSWLVANLWLKKIINIPLGKGLIFEGSSRRIEEARILQEALNWLGRKNIRVIYLNVPEKEVIRRLSLRRICVQCNREYSLGLSPGLKKCPTCGGKLMRRMDDYPAAIKHRMIVFRKNMIPVIRYFKKQKMVIEINGVGAVEEVYRRIIKELK